MATSTIYKDHKGDADVVARRAAEINGADWDNISADAQSKYRDGVRDAEANVAKGEQGQTALEQAAHRAIREWQAVIDEDEAAAKKAADKAAADAVKAAAAGEAKSPDAIKATKK